MVTTSKDKVQCFTLPGQGVTCRDNVTGKQLRKKNGVNATPGTIRVKKGAKKRAVAKGKARQAGPVAARTRAKAPGALRKVKTQSAAVKARAAKKRAATIAAKVALGARPTTIKRSKAGTAAMKAKMAKMRAMKKK